MEFNHVAITFQKLEEESSRLKITEILANLFKEATPVEASLIAYLAIGEICPAYLGSQFNFAEKGVYKVLSAILGLSAGDLKIRFSRAGDLGEVYAQEYSGQNLHPSLSLKEVHKKLTDFWKKSGIGSQEAKEEMLGELLQNLSSISGKYIIRIILGKLRLGFSDITLLDAFSWMECGDKSIRKDLEEAYNVSVDVGQLIKILKQDGAFALKKIVITPGIPIRPAAAERLPDAAAIVKKLGNCIAQPKLDGFRLQVHLDKTGVEPEVNFFSRNLQDMSKMFPDLHKEVVAFNVKTFIGEGEAIAYDNKTGYFLPFQETVKRRRKHGIEEISNEFPLKLYFFDVLFFNGSSLLNVSHEERRKIMLKIFPLETVKKSGSIFSIEEKNIEKAEELDGYFKEVMSQGLEGLVVKRPNAAYQPGKRNFNWIKFKRQESESLHDTIDCVILGYFLGEGRRAKLGIGALLVGVYNKKKDCFQTVAKIGTGLTDEEWRQQKKMCNSHSFLVKPVNVECAKELYPDVWVTPKIVCMIRADEITRSPIHTAGAEKKRLGLSLRLPRIMGYRPDKKAADATEIKELERLYGLSCGAKHK
jgi:DNA ligase 1